MMGLAKKKSGILNCIKRSMTISLCLIMIGSCLGIQSYRPMVTKAASNGISEDFESDTRLGMPMGNITMKRTAKAYRGKSALYVSNREQDWCSYSYDISSYQGKLIEFCARMRVDTSNCSGIACVKTVIDGEENYTWICCTPLKKGKYTKLAASYTIPEGATATLYFGTCETKDNSKQMKTSFYLDDVSIKLNTTIKENFDKLSDISDLKGRKIGKPVLSLVKNGKNNKALMVSNRKQSFDGYTYNLEAFAGNTISVKAKISAVGVKKNAKSQFIATLKTSDEKYDWIAKVTTKGTNAAVIQCASYKLPSDASKYYLYFEGTKGVSYVIDDIEISVVGDYIDPASIIHYADTKQYPRLKNLYQNYFKMGVACQAISHWNDPLSEIGNPVKENLIKQQFNSITFSNELKPEYNMGYRSKKATETNLPFVINPAAKELLDWAKKNKIQVRGHVLIWHKQCPDEIFCKDYKAVKSDGQNLNASCLVDREVMLERMKSYIYSTMEYMYRNGYANVIYAWDVVNEAIELGSNEYDLRESYWYQTIGPDFVYYAFKYTREAINQYSITYASKYGVDKNNQKQLKKIQPSLFYNEFNEFQVDKCDAIIKLTTTDVAGHNLLAEGYIDGIGLQGHVKANTDITAYMTSLKRCSDAVGEVQITEFDVAQTTSGVNAEYYQAKFYQEFFKALIQAIKDGAKVTSITIWGLTDDSTWKDSANPLLFHQDLSKKLAFDGIAGVRNGVPLPPPTYEAPDFKDIDADFEKEGTTAASEGFSPRGDGTLSVQSDVVYQGKYALRFTGRTEPWNGISFDVSRFVGQTIDISAWVKTAAPEAKLSADIDGIWPNLAVVDTSDGGWKQIRMMYKVPSDMTSLSLYFEAGTTDDIYIDSVKVKIYGMQEDFEQGVHIASANGMTHMPSFAGITDTQSHNDTGHSFYVKRSQSDAGMMFDVSKYIGYTVNVRAYVKTDDSKIRLGLVGKKPTQIAEVESNGEWTEIVATYPLSNQLTSAQMYIETNGKADFYVDDISITIGEGMEDCEGGSATNIFTTRWADAGKVRIVQDGAAGNHAALLTERTNNYIGTSIDVSPYIGMEVEISMDVRTDDSRISIIGDITDVWPNYMTIASSPGKYKTVTMTAKLPADQPTLKIFVRTEGTSDIYIDNLRIRRITDLN